MCINDQNFNTQYGNPFFKPKQPEYEHQAKMDEKLIKVADATRDLCKAFKNVDNIQQQRQAAAVCLLVAAEEYGWDRLG